MCETIKRRDKLLSHVKDHVHFDPNDGINPLNPDSTAFKSLNDIDKAHTRFFYDNSLNSASSMKEIWQKRVRPMCVSPWDQMAKRKRHASAPEQQQVEQIKK